MFSQRLRSTSPLLGHFKSIMQCTRRSTGPISCAPLVSSSTVKPSSQNDSISGSTLGCKSGSPPVNSIKGSRAGVLTPDKVVAQVSKPAVSRVSKPADALNDGSASISSHPADLSASASGFGATAPKRSEGGELGDTAGLETCAT